MATLAQIRRGRRRATVGECATATLGFSNSLIIPWASLALAAKRIIHSD